MTPDAGKGLRHHGRDAAFVVGVRVAVQEADRDGIVGAAAERPAHTMPRCRLVESADHLSVRPHAFRNLEGVAARDHRRRLPVVNVVDGTTALALQLEDVPESLGREECDPRPLALEHRVGRDGRSVHEIPGAGERDSRGIERGDRPPVGLRRRARHLGDAHATVLERYQVGEGPPDLDAHPDRRAHALARAPAATGRPIVAHDSRSLPQRQRYLHERVGDRKESRAKGSIREPLVAPAAGAGDAPSPPRPRPT